MGNTSTSEDPPLDYDLVRQNSKGYLEENYKESGQEKKIVFYGIGLSGKATIYRHIQMKLSLMQDREILMFTPNIYENLWQITLKCAEACIKRYSKEAFKNDDCFGAYDDLKCFDSQFSEFKEGSGFNLIISKSIQFLWSDEKFKNYYQEYKNIDFPSFDGFD